MQRNMRNSPGDSMLFCSVSSLEDLETRCDGLELRLDLFKSFKIPECKKPLLLTVRREQFPFLEQLAPFKPAYLDLEADTDPQIIKRVSLLFPETKLIGSYHDFSHTPSDLEAVLENMLNPLFYGYKIATFANSSLDAMRMILFIKNQKKRVAGICMGEKGQISRILAPNWINFAYKKQPTAPGQLHEDELLDIYHYPQVEPAIYALIGNPVSQSYGHLFHNAAFEGTNSVYVKIQLEEGELPEFFELAKQLPIQGMSVTAPFKEKFGPLPINTLKLVKGEYRGFNTDGEGAITAIEKKMDLKNKRVLLVGAGGAARAIGAALSQRRAKIAIYNRTKERARDLAKEIGAKVTEHPIPYDLLINCTGVSLDSGWINPSAYIMDISVRKNGYLKTGARIIEGHEMFFQQAALQQKIWKK